MNCKFQTPALAIALTLIAMQVQTALGEGISLRASDYAAAERWDNVRLATLVKNASVEPHWIGDGSRFWYTRQDEEGYSVVLVDCLTGERQSMFDVHRMSEALAQLAGPTAQGLAPFPDEILFTGEEPKAVYRHGAGTLICVARDPACRIGDGSAPDPSLLNSPNGQYAVFVRKHNLWLRDLDSGLDTLLTDDGELHAAYASETDQQSLGGRNSGENRITKPVATYWSPDGHWLITRRLDEREVEPYPFLESVPMDGSFRPRVHERRVALLGDAGIARTEHWIVNVRTGAKYPIELPQGFDLDGFHPGNRPMGWSADSRTSYMYVSSADASVGRLIGVDMTSGETRVILEESARSGRIYLSPIGTAVMVRTHGDELIWFSERSNYGHVYLYDLDTGKLKRQLTDGEGAVSAILHIDFERRFALVARSREGEGLDPYQQYVYRISLDGLDPVLITPETAHHAVETLSVSPNGDYLVGTFSTVSTPPRTVLRSLLEPFGTLELESADVTAVRKTGWRSPERIQLKAADGKTTIFAALYRAHERFSGSGPLPVIDYNYINSIFSVVPVSFMEALASTPTIGLTTLGFHVVVIDGRGTPMRSRDFRDIGYPAFLDIQIEDHVAAIRQLAEDNPDLDADRVGTWGSSNGGAGAARAILRSPDFFKVAVAAAGAHDYASLPPGGVKFFGVPEYADGSPVRPAPNAVPENYLPFDNAALAANLEGHLLLAYGDMDNVALPGTTHRLASALIDAGKTFDLLHMPNRGHSLFLDPYFKRRLRHYFVEHLHGLDPPAH